MLFRKGVQVSLFISTVIVLLLLVVLFKHSHSTAKAQSTPSYAQEIEAAKQAGVLVTPYALQAPLPPEDQNAAPIYAQLTNLLAAHPINKDEQIAESLSAYERPTDEQFARARTALKRHTDLLSLIHQATAHSQCVFVKDWSLPAAVHFEEIPTMRESTRLLVTESRVMAHDGNPLAAVKNQALGFQIAHHAANENFLLGLLTANSIGTLTQHGLQNILYLAGSDSAVADAVRMAVEKEQTPNSLAGAFQTEAGCDIVDLQQLRTMGPGSLNQFLGNASAPPIHMTPQEWNKFIDDNGSLLLKNERTVIASADLPYPKARPILEAVDTAVEQDKDVRHVIVLATSMSYGQLAEQRARAQALTEVTHSAAALLAWKDRHGAFPETLEEVLKPVPTDPFDGKPLRYRREGAGFVVYSVGKDNTYTIGTPDTKPARFAVVFRYPFPAYYQGPLKEY